MANPPDDVDESLLRRALELAREAAETDTPFGSLLERGGEVIAESTNTTRSERDVTAHPELKLARWAARELDDASDVTMYTSTEPCAMCAGAIYYAGIGRVVFSTPGETIRELAGPGLALTSRDLYGYAHEPPEVVGPVLEAEGRAVHDAFW